jgi:predicted O-methyltransferase YrrM
MVNYNLTHLTQPDDQIVLGRIQDDEALFLYSIIRGCRLERILEIGCDLSGYSAKNLLEALSFNKNGILYTCDLNQLYSLEENHKIIMKNPLDLTMNDLENKSVDLIFFDCNDKINMELYYNFANNKIINDTTILVLQDTNLHYPPNHCYGEYVEEDKGYAHQPFKREMVNAIKKLGYDIFSITTDNSKHNNEFPFRHGITVCKKFIPFNV